ncbi:MAG: hypothetical protein J4N87_05820, partial [Chloroflexi bacterium]|nr:hypothetical protein [Chloroflexota bacterium]
MNGFDDVALLLLIAVPMFGAIAMMFMPGSDSEETWYFAIFIAAISFALSVVIFADYDYDLGGFQLLRSYEWLPGPLDI